MSETTLPNTHDHHDANAPKLYATVLGILLILTFITVAASKVQFGTGMVNVIIALTIATIKASLVALFFMHLIHDKAMNSIILVSSFVFLGVFIGLCYTDQATRDDLKPLGLKVKPAVVAGAPGAAPVVAPVAVPGTAPATAPPH